MAVSVVMVTYGHEQFIKQSIEGVLMQDCDFDIELILANDCSPDLTDEVVRGILENHPKSNWIKYTKHPKNIGMISNFMWAASQATAKYIALCDGDDYWTDPLKLQKQVDFLEANEDYAICFHDVLEFHQNTSFFKDDYMSMHNKETHFDSLKIARGNFIHTPSVVLRNDFEIPNWFLEVVLGDWSLYLLQLKGRKIKRFKEKMAVYRVHDQGVWTKKEGYESERDMALTAKIILDNLQLSSEVISALQEFYNQHYNAYILAKGNGLSQLKRYIKKILNLLLVIISGKNTKLL